MPVTAGPQPPVSPGVVRVNFRSNPSPFKSRATVAEECHEYHGDHTYHSPLLCRHKWSPMSSSAMAATLFYPASRSLRCVSVWSCLCDGDGGPPTTTHSSEPQVGPTLLLRLGDTSFMAACCHRPPRKGAHSTHSHCVFQAQESTRGAGRQSTRVIQRELSDQAYTVMRVP